MKNLLEIRNRSVMTMQATRRGFALPTTILLLLLMTGGAVAAFTRAIADVRSIDNHRAETAAFALAEDGLERYLSRIGTLVPDTTMTLPGGTARVRATLIRPVLKSGDTALYVIRADGAVRDGDAGPEGRRTVAQLAYRIPGNRVGERERQSRWSQIPNAWLDNWSSW